MARVLMESLSKVFPPNVVALDSLSLSVEHGEFLVVLGPSGSGKTTLLRIIAGLERPTRGRVYIGEEVVSDAEKGVFVPPQRRDVGMVFQNWALYPNMKVYDNIAFPLELKGVGRGEVRRRVKEVAEVLGIDHLLDRYPRQLSGGQQQRVALARALVKNPKVLLLDEPFSNLDARVRITARSFVRKLQKKLNITTILVTHDQADAFAVGDRIVVINEGLVQQVGSPRDLYNYPVNAFVAGFIGEPPMNLVKVAASNGEIRLLGLRVKDLQEGEVVAGARPDEVIASKSKTRAVSSVKGRVDHVETLGSRDYATVSLGSVNILALVNPGEQLSAGEEVYLNFFKVHLFEPRGGKRVATLEL